MGSGLKVRARARASCRKTDVSAVPVAGYFSPKDWDGLGQDWVQFGSRSGARLGLGFEGYCALKDWDGLDPG